MGSIHKAAAAGAAPTGPPRCHPHEGGDTGECLSVPPRECFTSGGGFWGRGARVGVAKGEFPPPGGARRGFWGDLGGLGGFGGGMLVLGAGSVCCASWKSGEKRKKKGKKVIIKGGGIDCPPSCPQSGLEPPPGFIRTRNIGQERRGGKVGYEKLCGNRLGKWVGTVGFWLFSFFFYIIFWGMEVENPSRTCFCWGAATPPLLLAPFMGSFCFRTAVSRRFIWSPSPNGV